MRPVAYALAAAVGLLGVVMLLAASRGAPLRLVVGIVLLGAAAALVALARTRVVERHHHTRQVVELSGDVRPEDLKCARCGAHLSPDSVKVRAGGIFVECAYCGSSYQLEEEPKW